MPPQEPPAVPPSRAPARPSRRVTKRQSIFVVRHGDRWDYALPEWRDSATRLGDPPLSDLGHRQARETGAFLDGLLASEGVNAADVTFLSSPFLRCVQTSDEILSSFRKTDGDVAGTIKIRPECSVWEIDGHGGTAHACLPPVEERACYFPRLDTSHESLFVPDLPEDGRDGFLARIDRAAAALGERYPHDPDRDAVVVVVSHAAGCVALARSLAGLTLGEVNAAPPCGIFRLTRMSDTDEWELDHFGKEGGMNGYSAHLSDLGAHTIPWNHFGPKNVDKGYTGPPRSGEEGAREVVGVGGI